MPRLGTFITRRQADGIVGVVHQPQVGNDILHLPTLVEAGAAHQPVLDAVPQEGLLQDAGLEVGAVHHRYVSKVVIVVPHQALDLLGDGLSLVLLVVGLRHGDGDALPVVGPEVLLLTLLVGSDDVLGRLQNGLRRAVVLLQVDHLGLGEVLFEAEDVADVGVPP